MSSAFLTWAQDLIVQAYDQSGNLSGPELELQVTSVKPSKQRNKIPMTNALSPAGKAEWAPGIMHSHFKLAGIVDADNDFDEIWTEIMEDNFYAQVTWLLCKPIFGAGANNPLGYQCKCLLTDCNYDWDISQEGNIGRFDGEFWIVSDLVKIGQDTTDATVQGFTG